jgi:hypothetical protein
MTSDALSPAAVPAAASPPAHANAPALAFAGVALAALVWSALVRLPLWRMDGLDDAFYVEVAHLWTRGLPPYLYAYDVKPPGFFALLALAEAALGPTLDALRALAVVCDAATAVALVMLGRRFGQPAVGLFAALSFPVLNELVTANDAYSPLAALTVFAFLVALSQRGLMGRALISGLLIGAAGAVKQTAGFEALALLAVLTTAPEAAGRRLRVGAIFLAGAAVAPLAFLAYFAAVGGAGALIDDALVGALLRPASASEGLSFLQGLGRFFLLQKSDMALFACALLALLRRRQLAAALPGAPVAALILWFLAAAAGAIAQRAIAITYVGPMLAPSLLLAGFAVSRAAPELARLPDAARLVGLAGLCLVIALFNPGNDLSARLESGALAEVEAAIRASGPAPGDRLYVVNRGLWLYSALDWPPPTAIFYPGHTLCDFKERGPGPIETILASRPRYLVVADRRIHYVCEQADRWRAVDAALAADYRRIAEARGVVDSYDVYEAINAPAMR